jgi:CheY-like chemotaxis protein
LPYIADLNLDAITRKGMRMKRVLVVEDSKFLRVERTHTLKKAGYEVLLAVDGLEALQMARDGKPDLILLDMMLPKLDGPAVLKALKADPATAQIPVIVVSGLSQKNAAKLIQDGAAAFLEKELMQDSAQSLLLTIEKVFDDARL